MAPIEFSSQSGRQGEGGGGGAGGIPPISLLVMVLSVLCNTPAPNDPLCFPGHLGGSQMLEGFTSAPTDTFLISFICHSDLSLTYMYQYLDKGADMSACVNMILLTVGYK